MTESASLVTVVVCTRNRSTLLGETCASLLAVEPPPAGWEVVIVDNGSTDDTPEVAAEVRRGAPELVRVVSEPVVGLSSARNRGVAEARGSLIVFLDDDAFPARRWLLALGAAFERDETIACAGGPVEPLLVGELPAWFTGRFLPYLTVWDLGDEAIDLRYNEYPRGANISFRASALQRFGGFSTRLGRSGRSLLSCEEIELCLRLERGGLRTVYVPDARVRHTTPVDRLTPDWMERRFAAQGRSEAIVDWAHGGLRGLLRGLTAHRRYAREAAGDSNAVGGLFARCQRRALRGYLAGAVTAPVTVPRYRPPDPDVTLTPWP